MLIREGFPVKGASEQNLKEVREPVLQEETSRGQGVYVQRSRGRARDQQESRRGLNGEQRAVVGMRLPSHSKVVSGGLWSLCQVRWEPPEGPTEETREQVPNF